jgi:hypothetical protein
MNLVAYHKEQPIFDSENVFLTNSEKELFKHCNAQAYVIQDYRSLTDLTSVLFATKPTLIILNTECDFHHLHLNVAAGDFFFSPYDAVYVPDSLGYMFQKYSWLEDHRVDSVSSWIHDLVNYPDDFFYGRFYKDFSKQDYFNAFNKNLDIRLGEVTRFLYVFGNAMSKKLCSTFIKRSNTFYLNEGTFGRPNILFFLHDDVELLGSLELEQSTLVVTPFFAPLTFSVEGILASLKQSQPYPFLLKNVYLYKNSEAYSFGCVVGEFVL